MLTDVALPPIRRLIIYGVLEIGDDMDNVLSCTHIVVYGKLIAGQHIRTHISVCEDQKYVSTRDT